MGDVDKSGAEGRLQLLELDLHVLAQLEVECAQRLVEQQQRGLQHQAAGNRHALALPARQLVHALVLHARQADTLQHGADFFDDVSAPQAAPSQAIADVFADRHH